MRAGGVEVIELEAKSVLNRVPGMPFAWSINPYRGCYHQCVFCYARNTHTFYDRSGVEDWGTRLYAKVNAPEVLRRELARPSWRREAVTIGTATDPYQPLEGRYRITRRILAELAHARTPTTLITRSPLILRDIDVLRELSARAQCYVTISLPTVDPVLARELEPTVAPPAKRLLTIERLARAGIHTAVAIAPIVPRITDGPAQLAATVRAARDAGASTLWHSTLRLNATAKDSFFRYLLERQPDLAGEYRALYHGAYAPRFVTDAIEARFGAARDTHPLAPPPAIVPEPELAPLALF